MNISFERFQFFFEYKIYTPLLAFFYRCLIPFRVRRLRKKSRIRVLFMITELGTWKTEMLYKLMLKHNRFEPIIGISTSPLMPQKLPSLISYLERKGYEYLNFDDYNTWTIQKVSPDIIFYCKPYPDEYMYSLSFTRHLNSLLCYVSYGTNTFIEPWIMKAPIYNFCWQIYLENKSVAEEFHPYLKKFGRSLLPTGLPMFDMFMVSKEKLDNPWKNRDNRKRIIYAPHHTIGDMHSSGIAYSTFLDLGEKLLEVAGKYKDKAVFCFKPHPSLYKKLLIVWGKEKTDAYYEKWKNNENLQIEEGDYVGLFMHSDAMIHDCSSFTVEYHFTKNPVMYLVRDDSHDQNMTQFGRMAYQLHYKGKTFADIELFIDNLLAGKDPLKSEREDYYNNYLRPSGGKTACQNVIDAILGNV